MAQRNISEVVAGAVVLLVAAGFLGYAVANTGRITVSGYALHADFDHIDGLSVGSDVRLAGVRVGSVTSTTVNPRTYQAVVDFTVRDNIHLPDDSSAEIDSDSLLGGKYINLSPGGDEKTLGNGGLVKYTQSSISIEQLLGKFIFSMGNLSGGGKPGDGSSGSSTQQGGGAGGGLAPLK